jgi:hypothetical protein
VSRGKVLRWAPVAGTAAAGVLAGHRLAYIAGIPGAGHRSRILAQTGHSYWQLGVRSAALGVAVGLGAIVARRIGERSAVRASRVERWSFIAVRLMALQVLGYAVMETAERLAAGAPLSGMLSHHLLVLGLAFQVLTAVVGALLLTAFDRGVARLVAAIRRRRKPVRLDLDRVPPPSVLVPHRTLLPAGAAGPRSPPRR